jgi:predicted Zn finger-like uncharacterized protein
MLHCHLLGDGIIMAETAETNEPFRGELSRERHAMRFECQHCNQRLSVSAAAAGRMVRCPSCNNRIQIPALTPETADEADGSQSAGARLSVTRRKERQAWKESDPTNPNFLLSLGIGFGVLILWFALLLPFMPPEGKPIAAYGTMEFIASLFYKHFTVSLLNTMFFTWAMAIIFLKHRKIRHQRAALMLDVLPMNLGKEIDADNVGAFIDHVYSLPARLRDSLMVNRIRKGLELFEIRQNVSDVREMMASQSEIDSARIGGSYALVRAFLWGIPLLGFIGTVVGLSHAIAGMNFANVEDVGKIIGAINNVTSGLGTAFDATLLGLVLALTLNFPINALAKQEDDNLYTIDAFCNEVLLPRLKDAAGARALDGATIAESIVKSIAGVQDGFMADLSRLARQMNEYAGNLEKRIESFQNTVTAEFVGKTEAMRSRNEAALKEAIDRIVKFEEAMGGATAARNDELRAATDAALKQSLEQVGHYLASLEKGIAGLSKVLQDLGEKQIAVAIPVETPRKKRRWFGRG